MMLGNLLILLSSASFVIGSILSKDLLKIYSPLVTTAFAFLVGAITFFIPAIFDYIQNPSWVLNLNVLGVLGLLYITILSSIVAFFLMVWGLSKTNVIQANLFQYIEPAIAATLAVPILGERISYSFIVGTCLVVLGTYWGSFGKPHHHHPHHKHHRT
ncbi:DMT family transporter [Candidatus Daviesbacteria bacterium]|nr:DMT family transporter [Candidatus Daviesbacteria bacterium]